MTHTAFFDVVRQTAHAAINGSQPPALGGKLLTHLKIIAKCFSGDEVVTVDEGTADFLILAKTSASGAASLIDTTAVLNTSDPHEPQYEFEWNPADSVQLRTVLDAAADPTQPVELRYEFRFEREGEKGAIGGPIWFLNNFFRPETAAPDATTDSSWTTLKSRVLAGANLTRTVDDAAKTMTFAGEDGEANAAAIAAHTARTDNPHVVTKAQVGLGNVDNTSDAAKPISTAQQAALDGKAAVSHTHAISDVTNLQSSLDGKAASSHTHAQSDVTGLVSALAGKAAASHTHAISDVTNLQSSLDGKAASSHTHAQSEVTGLVSALAGKANASHTHAISDVTALQTALDAKEPGQTAASEAEMEAGTEEAIRSMSPLRVAQAIAALAPGGGGGSLAISKMIFVDLAGDNMTAQAGNPALPYATAQAAYEAWLALNGEGTIVFGPGNFGSITVTNSMAYWLRLIGRAGPGTTIINVLECQGHTTKIMADESVYIESINANGTNGTGGTLSGESGTSGTATAPLYLRGVRFYNLYARGGNGGNGVTGADGDEENTGQNGGDGGNGGALSDLIMIDCWQNNGGDFYVRQGFGGGAGNGGADGGLGAGSPGTPGANGGWNALQFVRCNLRVLDAEGINPAPTADTYLCLIQSLTNNLNHNGNGTTLVSWPDF